MPIAVGSDGPVPRRIFPKSPQTRVAGLREPLAPGVQRPSGLPHPNSSRRKLDFYCGTKPLSLTSATRKLKGIIGVSVEGSEGRV